MHKTMKIILTLLAVIAVVVIAALLVLSHPAFGRRPSPQRRARIEASHNWRDGMFRNQIPTPQFTGDKSSIRTLWNFLTDNKTQRVPHEPLNAVHTDLNNLPEGDLLVWFGHSSYLFRLGGMTFLVDPVLKMEFPASLMMKPFRGTDIYTPDDMPHIDCLIITHEHWDHLDYATLRDIRHKVSRVVCPLGVGEYLEYWGYPKDSIAELDWYEEVSLSSSINTLQTLQTSQTLQTLQTSITCLPTRHFSNRLFSRNQTLWASFLVQVAEKKVYVGGDGGYDGRFREIRRKYGQVDLAFFENGQYNKDWANIHLMPQDLEEAILELDAKQVFTVHHDKFSLAPHAWYEPDSVAKTIAERDSLCLLDQPIGTVVRF